MKRKPTSQPTKQSSSSSEDKNKKSKQKDNELVISKGDPSDFDEDEANEDIEDVDEQQFEPSEEDEQDIMEEEDVLNSTQLSQNISLEDMKKTCSLAFQQMDADYTLGEQKPGYPGPTNGNVPIVRLYGVTEEGYSVTCHVRGYTPYFYIDQPDNFNPDQTQNFAKFLNTIMGERNIQKGKADKYIVNVSIERKKSLMHYSFGSSRNFLRIETSIPPIVPHVREALEKGIHIPGLGFKKFQTYESNVLFVLRCMIDSNMVGANWVELPAGSYKLRNDNEKVSHSQIEVDVSYEDLLSHLPTEPGWHKIAPVRILSFDIECKGKDGHFPQAESDPVIVIANYVTVQGRSEPLIKNVMCLGDVAPIVGVEIHSYKNEKDMLEAWRNFMICVDPDIITGYNIINFDLPYLINRAKALKVGTFPFLGRIANKRSQMKNSTFSSRAYGTRESKDINIEGRIQLDVLQAIQRDHKLSSYSLNSVSAHFLGDQKEEVHHSIISTLHEGSDEDRRRLASYCLKDAVLPIRLLDKLMIIINYIEMARVTGIPVSFILKRGQQIKVISQLLRKAKEKGYIMPTITKSGKKEVLDEEGEATEGETYEGGFVLTPKTGYYDIPITTLDFASLYPSIMIAHNLCYTTLLKKEDIAKLSEDQYIKTPSGDYFIKRDVQQGLLPLVLEELLAARKQARKDLENATDPTEKAVMNGRQLALKVSANSVYGFTGATVGMLPCLEISASVTAFGREMIQHTKTMVEEMYTVKNGYEANATVIYGDTDSVMVKFGTRDIKKAMELGLHASQEISKTFVKPIKLEFEKVYYPYLLLAKKRYAGLLWTKTEKYDKMDAKGIVTVRRDNCALVRNLVNTCLHLILVKKSIEAAVNYAKSVISDLLMNRMDISMLVITKALVKKSDKYKAKQTHVELAERMAKRDPSTAPRVGDRIPYVIVKAHKGAKAYEKSEDPIWVLENSIPIDAQYYLEHQIKKPLEQIFSPIIDNTQSLFVGEHTRAISIPTPSKGGIMKFTQKQLRCLGCRNVLAKNGGSTICNDCKQKGIAPKIYESAINKRNHYEDIYSRVWTYCQRCQGSLHADVLCTNRDCPVFYMRKKVQKELADCQDVLNRFDEEVIYDF
ncbi:hypothetical protein C9374_001204 [Naegleria lovaniensis]|uniref:DNA polymerase n=1 Tax=Naegleria lovaniensis TaxID=51637 RepID=A0AA88KL91_NAELO|nr:uncharacterized protein C9374_001204 [Naegleria lovaniensis]KAG2387610.1 hypothetical protein C9374_001204 [Naegleria lovaniensis]